MLILGMGALAREDGAAVLASARQVAESCGMIAEGWNGFNVLHTAAARVGGLDLGFVPGSGGRDLAGILEGAQSGAVKMVWLLGADEIDTNRLGEASSSIRAITATAAPIAPTSSCRVLPTPRRTAPM